MKTYIADIINSSEIRKWNKGDRILITGQTGRGKSQWVKDQLYQFCKENNKKILLLSNRVVLKEQNRVEIVEDEKVDVISLRNYQTLENSYLYGNTLNQLFEIYDYIIYDEIHYILSDSSFNGNTDILMLPLQEPSKDKIFVFITATPEAILKYNQTFEFRYTVEPDYSYIENLFFYFKNNTVEKIIRSIPLNEKALYFGNALDALELSNRFSDSEFICSDNNREFNRKSSTKTKNEIIKENKFNCQFLFSTKVLDNGINIFLPELKHIFVDMLDPIDIIQCLGRKRIFEDEKINVYIKNINGHNITPLLQRTRNRLKLVEERINMTKEEFQDKYARKQLDNIILNNGEINQAKLFYSKYIIDIFSRMCNDKEGYKKYICHALCYPVNKTKLAENYFGEKNLISILDSFLEQRLYKNEKLEEFKNDFFEQLFAPKRKIDIRARGITTVQSILEEENLPYIIGSGRDTTMKNRNKSYWWITKRG